MCKKELLEENETFAVENKKVIRERKIKILEEFFKIQNMSIEGGNELLELQAFTKCLRLTLVFMRNSALQEKFIFFFSTVFY